MAEAEEEQNLEAYAAAREVVIADMLKDATIVLSKEL